MIRYCIYILITLNFYTNWAQTDSLQVAIQQTDVIVHDFKENLAERYTDDEFDYTAAEGEAENILARIINWIFKGLKDMFGVEISPDITEVIKNLVYFIFIAIVLYILIRVLGGKDVASFFGKKNKIVAPIHFSEEHIENIDIEKLIADALSVEDYRLAIRYMYLKSIQDLSLKKLIDYHFEKTNSDYQNEIKDQQLKQHFSDISYLYNYIWYGKFDITKEKYQDAKKYFEQLNIKMKKLG